MPDYPVWVLPVYTAIIETRPSKPWSNILGSLLHQFLTSDALPHTPAEVYLQVEVLENNRKKNKNLEAKDAIHMLKLTLQQLVGSFICIELRHGIKSYANNEFKKIICIDALDELEQNTRRQLLESHCIRRLCSSCLNEMMWVSTHMNH